MIDEHPQPLRRGDRVDRNWVTINKLNELLQPALSDIRRLSSGLQDFRQFREHKSGGSGGSAIRYLRLKQIGDNWLRCQTFTGDVDGGVNIYVARFPELQRARFDGKTIAFNQDGDQFSAIYNYSSPTKRTKTIAGSIETEVIIPYYIIDNAVTDNKSTIILAGQAIEPTGVNDPLGSPITLVEITNRAWTKPDL